MMYPREVLSHIYHQKARLIESIKCTFYIILPWIDVILQRNKIVRLLNQQ